jgi:hypothetical protein
MYLICQRDKAPPSPSSRPRLQRHAGTQPPPRRRRAQPVVLVELPMSPWTNTGAPRRAAEALRVSGKAVLPPRAAAMSRRADASLASAFRRARRLRCRHCRQAWVRVPLPPSLLHARVCRQASPGSASTPGQP